MKLKVNGEELLVPDETLLADLLRSLGEKFEGSAVAVAVNLSIVQKDQRATHVLKAGDQVDIVTAVGGG